jgi:tRNA A37 threonylcarbamoyladenosine synthetase subunit TsaC/SUA5/YrdC
MMGVTEITTKWEVTSLMNRTIGFLPDNELIMALLKKSGTPLIIPKTNFKYLFINYIT